MNRIALLPLVLLATGCEPGAIRDAREIVRANPQFPTAEPEFQNLEYLSGENMVCGEVRWRTAGGRWSNFGPFHVINGAAEYPHAPPAASTDPFWRRDKPCTRVPQPAP